MTRTTRRPRESDPPLPPLLPLQSLLRLLGVMTLLIAPHALRLPAWESASVMVLILWRGIAARRGWRMPHVLLKIALTFAAFAGVFASYGRFWGQNAGVALLVVMLSLKLTELRDRRDVMVTVFLLYFLTITHFLFSQALWTSLYLLLCAMAITAVLIDVHHVGEPRPLPMLLRLGGTLIVQALPLALLMFILFPRLPGPLWSLSDDSSSGRSGLADSMSPGDIGTLALSDEVAFRARFDGATPAPGDRYWRGPLLTDFDGRTWTRSLLLAGIPPPPAKLSGPAYRYELTLEPTRSHSLFALDLPQADHLPESTHLTGEYQLMSDQDSGDVHRYRLVSQPRYQLQARSESESVSASGSESQLPASLRAAALALPPHSGPRARALAAGWRAAARSDDDVVQAALTMIHQQPFVYTLQPGTLSDDDSDRIDRVDEFLFATRRGFCEHYAGSFTFLMRAAGIPARVVTGYVGGEKNPFGDWLVLRQSDAHAWSEVWLTDRGWVRVDPTAAVAPERVERSVSQALSHRRSGDATLATLDWSGLRYRLDAGWDWIDARWTGMVLGYGTDQQREFLSRVGLGDWQNMLLALTGTVTAALTVLGLALMRRTQAAPEDPLRQLWRRGLRPLRKLGLEQRAEEGPRDFVDRVIAARPHLAAPLQRLLRAYLQLRYQGATGPALLTEMKQSARDLRRRF